MPSKKRTIKETATPNEHNVEVTDEVSNNDNTEEVTEESDERFTPAA